MLYFNSVESVNIGNDITLSPKVSVESVNIGNDKTLSPKVSVESVNIGNDIIIIIIFIIFI
jgi:UDP-3-O-[3-hydroxymyristoyl] glucosamine N-acyltransferase